VNGRVNRPDTRKHLNLRAKLPKTSCIRRGVHTRTLGPRPKADPRWHRPTGEIDPTRTLALGGSRPIPLTAKERKKRSLRGVVARDRRIVETDDPDLGVRIEVGAGRTACDRAVYSYDDVALHLLLSETHADRPPIRSIRSEECTLEIGAQHVTGQDALRSFAHFECDELR
jgi:hypothetical protein